MEDANSVRETEKMASMKIVIIATIAKTMTKAMALWRC
jgi:hypothetical protein